MSGAGSGNRYGEQCFTLKADDARPVRAAAIRAERAALLGLDGQRVALVNMVVDDDVPLVVMFNGDPFLLDDYKWNQRRELAYAQVRPYRADCMVVEDHRC